MSRRRITSRFIKRQRAVASISQVTGHSASVSGNSGRDPVQTLLMSALTFALVVIAAQTLAPILSSLLPGGR